jgi:HSP20 family molecular chaperone IbpA
LFVLFLCYTTSIDISMYEPRKQFVHMVASASADGSIVMQEVEHAQPKAMWESPHGGVEGQLSVDVYVTPRSLVVIAPMAGADTTAISVTLHDDVLTIRGVREMPVAFESVEQGTHAECFWGPFSRTVVLPHAVLSHKVQAEYTNGVLVVELTKAQIESRIPVHIIDE